MTILVNVHPTGTVNIEYYMNNYILDDHKSINFFHATFTAFCFNFFISLFLYDCFLCKWHAKSRRNIQSNTLSIQVGIMNESRFANNSPIYLFISD